MIECIVHTVQRAEHTSMSHYDSGNFKKQVKVFDLLYLIRLYCVLSFKRSAECAGLFQTKRRSITMLCNVVALQL